MVLILPSNLINFLTSLQAPLKLSLLVAFDLKSLGFPCPCVLHASTSLSTKFILYLLQIYLEKKGIQTRTIFTGNILRQPIMRGQYYKKHKLATSISNNVMKNGILIGCHHGLNSKELKYICNTFAKYFNNVKN